MKIKNFLRSIIFIVILIALFVYIPRFSTNNQVLIRFTNSISYDAKIYETRRLTENNFDYIAIGSSMTLNNLNSDVLQGFLNERGENFYNFASWGTTMSDNQIWLEILLEKYNPKGVIIFSSMEDFEGNAKPIDKDAVSAYIRGRQQSSFYLKHSVFSDLTYINEYRKLVGDTTSYDSLHFDEYGGVNLSVYEDSIEQNRWEKTFTEIYNKDNINYNALQSISQTLKEKGIDFYFVQMPSRPNYVADENSRNILNQHVSTCEAIINETDQYFYNGINYELFSDFYFSDYTHMNVEGSMLITNLFINNSLSPSLQ